VLDAEASKSAESEDIVVTGSRIRRKDLAGAAPVVVFTRQQIQASGRANIGEFLQTIPEQSNAIGRSTNNGGDGSIRINLRGMGAQSTLVLLNGRRLAPGGTGADKSVDLSAIPTGAIERVEILKDGASAIYGSDAIAGVVNIVTRKRYEGAEASLYGSTTTFGDGSQVDASALVGTTNDKGGIMFSFGYYNGAPVWAGNRKFSRVQNGLQYDPDGKSSTPYELGSGTVPGGRIVLGPDIGVQNGNAAYNKLVRTAPLGTKYDGYTLDPTTRQWREFRGPKLTADGWNYQPYNYLVTPQERFNIFSSGDYRLGKYARLFFTSFYTKKTSKQTLAPEPLVLDAEGVVVSADNIYNPFGRDFDAVRRRLMEFGRRSFRQDVNNFQLNTGIDGELPDSAGPLAGWSWEAVFNFSRNELTETKTGNLRIPKLQAALGPSFVDASGRPQCGTALSPIAGCVPLNVFGGAGTITQDQVQGLTYTGVLRGYNQILGAQFNTNGELFHLWSKNAVGLALGYEFRSLNGGQIPDPITVAGETTGNKVLPTGGGYQVHEIYAELNVPVFEKLPLLYSLELVGAARASFYSNFGDTFNYKVGGRWAPVDALTVRGTYSTAFRAPNIQELYQGQQDNFPNVTDPCASVKPGSDQERSCGAAANNRDNRTQQLSRVGGTTTLQPETARIFTVGVVLQPPAFKNISLTVDYFNTSLKHTISTLGEGVILQSCYPGASGVAPLYCDHITRDPTTQRLVSIQNLNTNVGTEDLDGIDFSGQYDVPTHSAGLFSLLTTVSWLNRYDRKLADGTKVHGAGNWDLSQRGTGGVGGAFPHVRFNASVSWALDGLWANVRTFFVGPYKECGDQDGDLSGGGLCYATDHVGEHMVSPYNTWDVVVGYSFASSAGKTTVSVGSTNVFNQAPPRVYNGFAATTDTYTYDLVMRQVYARIGHQF
jgi:outer membrane receptor protein involved in Fe transport